jgi:hypothetical protein
LLLVLLHGGTSYTGPAKMQKFRRFPTSDFG